MKWIVLGATALTLAACSEPAKSQNQGGAPSTYGAVTPCSLAGINPADHPEVFGNPVVAREMYGFVRGPDGNWQVIPNCESVVKR